MERARKYLIGTHAIGLQRKSLENRRDVQIEERSQKLESDLAAVFESHQVADDGTLAMDVAYLEVVAVRA